MSRSSNSRDAYADPILCLKNAELAPIASASAQIEKWTLKEPFKIARATRYEIELVLVELSDGHHIGRGESCPEEHYGETPEGVLKDIESFLDRLRNGEAWHDIHDELPAGAARNAVDCAIWDLAAKSSGKTIAQLLAKNPLKSVETVFTISLDTPDKMAAQARHAAKAHRTLKIKLGREGDDARIRAVREAVPDTNLIVDVNEHWSLEETKAYQPLLAEADIRMLEQPLPAGKDAPIADVVKLVRFGADESIRTTADMDAVAPFYDVVNIKLDKTGGLTEALRLSQLATDRGLSQMVGCMLGTSLAMAPAVVIAQACEFVDLDAPLLIGHDRESHLIYENGSISPPDPALWG